MGTIFRYIRYLVVVSVIGLLLASLAVFVYGGVTTFTVIVESFQVGEYNAEGARTLSVEMIELIDLFLLGTFLLITATGLYQLFIEPNMELPEWLYVTNLEQLKFNLLAVVVVMLAVLFIGEVAGRLAESAGILEYGVAVAAVIIAIAVVVHVFQRVHHAKEEHLHETFRTLHEKAEEKAGEQPVDRIEVE